eukprot:TRINITY_DN887_c4_g1_i1.p1 TRINITY_DN887_c4_g1~~TRINITY_DN887_c4_g1_i1.p1  ORF type:complete len:295 (+),score=23.83 TRINITY_DN887_c4_g1_i1:40-885(+)
MDEKEPGKSQLSDVLRRSHDLLSALKVQSMQKKGTVHLHETQAGSAVSPSKAAATRTAEQMTSPINFTPVHSPIGAPEGAEDISFEGDDDDAASSVETFPIREVSEEHPTPKVIQEAERTITTDWITDRSQTNYDRTRQEHDSYLSMKRAYIRYLADTALGRATEIPDFSSLGPKKPSLLIDTACEGDSYSSSGDSAEADISHQIRRINVSLQQRRLCKRGKKPVMGGGRGQVSHAAGPSTYLDIFRHWGTLQKNHKERALHDNLARLSSNCYYPFGPGAP